jgi:hypothetical protein
MLERREGIFPNVDFNYRNGYGNDEDYLLDELLYRKRFTIERTNARMDRFRTVPNRFDFTVSSWEAFNYIAFAVISPKKIKQTKKSG